jgi:MoxR-vWA-beta-propeller ternary system domain bpX5
MLSVGSQQRVTPLAPEAALALGPVALAFGRRLLELSDEQLGRLRGVAGEEALLVLGASADLPWCDGIAYFGREPEEPSLLLPCASSPGLPATLLARALERRFEGQGLRRPFLVSLDPPRLLPVASARGLERAALRAWLEATGAPGAHR